MTDLLPPTQLGRSGRLESVLASLLATAPELEAAAVVSFDGLPMASALPEGMDEDRVAAMSAALLSLGDRAAQGLGRGDLSQVYVEGRHGTVFLVSADDEAVLVAVAASRAKVGLMLFEVRRAAEAVAAALVADDLDTTLDPLAAPVAATAPEPADDRHAGDGEPGETVDEIDEVAEVAEVDEVHDVVAPYAPDPILDAVLAPAPVPPAAPAPTAPPVGYPAVPPPPAPPVGYPAAAYPPPPPYIPAPPAPPAPPVQVPVAPPAAAAPVRPVTVPATGTDGRAWSQSPVVEQGWG